ncbi:MAG: sugar ABC transporter permease [Oscillospiraceae bacterium]|nr:sugar ABC transporter permease [Oscillospiraceae bacterium]
MKMPSLLKKPSLMQKRSMQGYLYILPWIIGFLLFFITPMIQTAIYSFNKLDKVTYEKTWMGLKNYIHAFRADVDFPIKLVSSLKSLIDVVLILVFAYFVALLLRKPFKGATIVKAIFFLTVILSSDLFMQMQMTSGSLNGTQMNATMQETQQMLPVLQTVDFNKYFADFGIGGNWIQYLNDSISNIFNIMVRSGIQIFIFLAALYSIPESMYEAAEIEGATAWEIFWIITFPMTGPMLLVNAIYTIVDSFSSSLNQVIVYINDISLRQNEIGYASALSWIYFLCIAVILAIVYLMVHKKIFYQN